MATLTYVLKRMIKSRALLVILSLFVAGHLYAQGPNKVTTYKDENGWKLKVDGNDFYIKGVVWGYTPRGETYTYNLWAKPEAFIKKMLDHDFGLMAKAGINAIRTFTIIPPKWVTYIYKQHGIMTVVNPLMGRYGANVGGVWRPFTDYSDPLTRETLKRESLEVVKLFKDVPGVLMFAFGNESNYGLSWSSFEIENLPVGEQQREKAKYLYSLFDEVITEGKAIAPNHPFTIVNGDIQYLDIIARHADNWDLLGTNSYRGMSFTDLWKNVKGRLDLPVVFFEFGSDAFNAKNFVEDQAAQAIWLKAQWQEIFNKSYGKGEEGNALGGFVFEWRDEWWKYLQTENLDKQDRTASWANGGYSFDYVEGQNNMNEEWFGITRLGNINADGVYVAEPRTAYYVLAELFKVDPYNDPKDAINRRVRDLDMEFLATKGEVEALKFAKQESDMFSLEGGSFEAKYLVKGIESDIDEDGEDGLEFSDGQMLFLDFAFQPTKRISGDFSINILGNVAESDMEFVYGDRGRTVTVRGFQDPFPRERNLSVEGSERVEIYDFQGTYAGDSFDLNLFYHVPRYHWKYEGDFYGLLRETTDMDGQDIWNDKAPYGAEIVGKEDIDGLKVVFGPEIYWGANPKALLKYEFDIAGAEMAFMHSEDIAEKDSGSGAAEATEDQSRQTTIYAKTEFAGMKLELGGIMSAGEKEGDKYDRIENGNVVVDEIEFEDTLGAKGKLSFSPFAGSQAYVAIEYAGLVADGGDPLEEFGTQLPYSSLGNKKQVEGGIMVTTGDLMIFPRVLYRENIVNANPYIAPSTDGTNFSPGIGPRNIDEDPFAVLDNREAQSAEIYFTYDPTPASSFYHWNVDMLEDAEFAFNLGLTATKYKTATDAYTFYLEEFETNAAFGEGLPEEDVWLLKSKMIFNPSAQTRFIADFEAGKQQAAKTPVGDAAEFYRVQGKLILDQTHIISGYVEVDGFGQYDFQEDFNVTFPLQVKAEYAMLLDSFKDEKKSSKVGVKLLYRTFDEDSPEGLYEDGDYQFEISTYFKYSF